MCVGCTSNEDIHRILFWFTWVLDARRRCNRLACLCVFLWWLVVVDVGVLSARFRRNDSTFNNVLDAQERERRIRRGGIAAQHGVREGRQKRRAPQLHVRLHMHIRRAFVIFGLFASVAHAQGDSFHRFTDELPQLLETDAVTVMARGLTHDFAGKLCARLGNSTGEEAQREVAEWRRRNDPFFRAAASVLNEFGDRYLPAGESAKQGYFQMILRTTAKKANQRAMRQLNGANLDNNVVPPERACSGLAHLLHDGVADFERTPEITRALVPYMQRKGIQ